MSTADELMGLVQGLRRVVRRRLRAELPGPALRGAHLELLQLVEAEPEVGVAAAARSLHLAGNSTTASAPSTASGTSTTVAWTTSWCSGRPSMNQGMCRLSRSALRGD